MPLYALALLKSDVTRYVCMYVCICIEKRLMGIHTYIHTYYTVTELTMMKNHDDDIDSPTYLQALRVNPVESGRAHGVAPDPSGR